MYACLARDGWNPKVHYYIARERLLSMECKPPQGSQKCYS